MDGTLLLLNACNVIIFQNTDNELFPNIIFVYSFASMRLKVNNTS